MVAEGGCYPTNPLNLPTKTTSTSTEAGKDVEGGEPSPMVAAIGWGASFLSRILHGSN